MTIEEMVAHLKKQLANEEPVDIKMLEDLNALRQK